MSEVMEMFRGALAAMDRVRAEALFDRALAEASPVETVERLIVPALRELGEDWYAGRIALSQIYMSGRICEELVTRALPAVEDPVKRPRRAIVVLHDYHVLGKRIVHSVLRAGGFAVLDYGRLGVDDLLDRIAADRVHSLFVSTLMLPSALKVKQVREGLERRALRVRIAVGGAPFLFDSELWREVGADAMGHSAGDALTIARRWEEEDA